MFSQKNSTLTMEGRNGNIANLEYTKRFVEMMSSIYETIHITRHVSLFSSLRH